MSILSFPTLSGGYSTIDSVKFLINFGDGNVVTEHGRISTVPFLSAGDHVNYNYTQPGVYNVKVIAIAPDNKRDTFIDTASITIIPCGNVSGHAYMDLNNNCLYDTSDFPIWNSLVVLSDNSNSNKFYATTNYNGKYTVDLPLGKTYSATINSPHFTTNCPSGGHTTISPPVSSIDFGITCNPYHDLSGQLSGAGFRPGRQHEHLMPNNPKILHAHQFPVN